MYTETKNTVQNSFSITPALAAGTYILMLAGDNLHASQQVIVANK
jgi:hypothetical protein